MKNLNICLFSVTFFLTSTGSSVIAGAKTNYPDSTQTIASAKVLLVRMDSINALDKRHLKASELKMLKKELRSIRGELKELDGGNYVPVKSLIILLLVPIVVYNLIE